MWRLLRSCCCCWWIFSLCFPASVPLQAERDPARTGNQAEIQAPVQSLGRDVGKRLTRAITEETYWAYSGAYGPDEGWAAAYPECREKNQSPINIVDQNAKVSTEYQELTLEGFATESSNKTSMKNTGKTVAITLKDDYFVRGAGLPGRFKAEKVEFHWGPSNGSEGSEHSIDGRRFPVEMQIYMYNSDDFDSLNAALREKRIIAAMSVFFQVREKDNPVVDPIIHGLKGVVHHEKETFLEPFVLKDLLPSSLGSYYRYTGSLTTPPCSKVVEWIIFSRPIYISYKQLEAFYSIFTTEQQDHVKSVEYLRSNFRPIQSLDGRHVFKSAVRDAWMPDLTDNGSRPYDTEPSNVCSSAPTNMKVQHVNSSTLVVRWAHPEITYHPPILHFLVSYSWTAHDDSFEETHLTDAKHKLEAIISPVSPDVLYLFRVQAICMNDMRSDFSQSMLFRANTTRIFEGTRIVKTGMPTLSSASSADMAPISSGSSTWTSSGIPFSFVSMATGIGPSSSGSQATVASLVTSTLLAGLGFSGSVIASFPSSIWPSLTPTRNPSSACHTTRGTKPTKAASAATTAVAKDNGEDGDEENKNGQRNDRKREGGDEDKDEKKVSEKKDVIPNFTAKNKKQTERDAINPRPSRELQSEVDTHNPLYSNPTTTKAADEICAFPVPKDPAASGWDKNHWSFSIYTDHPTMMTTVTHPMKPGSGAGLGHAEWLLLLVVLLALTFYLIPLLAVLLYWRRCFQTAHFYVENRTSLMVVHNEIVSFIPIQDDMEASPPKQIIKHVSELFSYDLLGFPEDFQEVLKCSAEKNVMLDHSNSPGSKHKRYIDTVTCDHSRVKLKLLAGKDSKHKDSTDACHVDKNPDAMVLQHCCTKWKDLNVLTLVCRSSATHMSDMRPILVHCRPGVGWTEIQTFADDMLRQIQNKTTSNVLFFEHILNQCYNLVQTELISRCNTMFRESVIAQKECSKGKSSCAMFLEKARVDQVSLRGIRNTDYADAYYIMVVVICDAFTATLLSRNTPRLPNKEQIGVHNYILDVTQDDLVMKIFNFQCPRWPNPKDSQSTIELIIIKEETTTRAGPAVVHDSCDVRFPSVPQYTMVFLDALVLAVSQFSGRILQRPVPVPASTQGSAQHVSTKENGSAHLARNFNRATMSMFNRSSQAVNAEFLV